MQRVDDIFRDFVEFKYIDELARLDSLNQKYAKIREIVSKVNVFKGELSDLSVDEQLYLDYKLQQKGVALDLCPNFHIFYSNRNNKFHQVCKAQDGQRAYCRGNLEKCVNGKCVYIANQ